MVEVRETRGCASVVQRRCRRVGRKMETAADLAQNGLCEGASC